MALFSPFFRLPGRWHRRRARRTRMAVQTTAILVVLLILIPIYVVYKPPKLAISYFQQRFPEVLFQVNTARKIVALTIDDSPSQYTREIVDILKTNDVSATFFVIGNQVSQHPDVLAEIVASGSELGNHAMHDEPTVSLTNAALEAEIREVDGYIEQAYKTSNKDRGLHLFRPGSGVFSQRILDVVTTAGYKTILGSIYPHDPFISTWRLNAWHILSMLRPGAVIICHDRRSWTVPMLKKVVPEMKRKGYEVVSVSKFLEVTKT
ncbi:Polysaccharide deacetylase family protein [Zymoseptoria brevis]|uniref:chitin deacetylase n=1 Tax=Zymoseptoria brevis TaxID=1047168 RepID=A0A0F4GF95_9PEZI|nr:Polysaccharide deacetylase family protein [Zymoseptoria brevis]